MIVRRNYLQIVCFGTFLFEDIQIGESSINERRGIFIMLIFQFEKASFLGTYAIYCLQELLAHHIDSCFFCVYDVFHLSTVLVEVIIIASIVFPAFQWKVEVKIMNYYMFL